MTTVPDEGTSQLKQSQVVGRLLVVAHQYGSALGQPAQGAFYHPPSGGEGFCAPSVPLLLPNAPDMRTVLVGGNGPVACGIVIPFVQAQVLRDLGAPHYHAPQGRSQHFRVMDVGSSHRNAQGSACCVDQDALLASGFAPVGGVASNGAPPNALCPWSNPPTAIPSSPHPTPGILLSGQTRCPPAPHTLTSVGRSDGWMVLSSPNSLGRWFHWQPLRSRKIIPSSIFRWSTGLRPFDLGGSNSSITGSIRSQRSSGTSQIVGNGFPSTTIPLHPPLHQAEVVPPLVKHRQSPSPIGESSRWSRGSHGATPEYPPRCGA